MEDNTDEIYISVFCDGTRGVRRDLINLQLTGDADMLQDIADNFSTGYITLRRPKEIASIGHRYMDTEKHLTYSTQTLEEAIVSRIMAVNPNIEIEPKIMLKEGEVVSFARNKLYVEATSNSKVYISKQIDVEEFINYKFEYPSSQKYNKPARFPLRITEETQSFSLMTKPLHEIGEEKCTFNLVSKIQGCTRACCCYLCCKDRCPEPFDGIPWDDDTCSGPEDLRSTINAMKAI